MKITVDLKYFTDRWEMAEKFDEFYEMVRMHRQMKNGRPVDRKLVRQAWLDHLNWIAADTIVNDWKRGTDQVIEELVNDWDHQQENALYNMVKNHKSVDTV